MGYYATMVSAPRFKSDSTVASFNELWKTFKVESPYLDIYKWDFYDGAFGLDMEEWFNVHYDSERLAEFVSKVIAEGERTIIEFVGEDGGQWGYYIERDKVLPIEYVKMVEGVRLEELLRRG